MNAANRLELDKSSAGHIHLTRYGQGVPLEQAFEQGFYVSAKMRTPSSSSFRISFWRETNFPNRKAPRHATRGQVKYRTCE